MGVLLAAVSAIAYGSADFLGGMASRREAPLVITWYSQMVGLVSILLVALVVPAQVVTGADWVWGGLGGIAGSIGLLLLYGALARGPMAVVAPITALCSALVPVLAGVLVDGDRPTVLAVIGVLLALPAIVLVAMGGDTPDAVEQPRAEPRVVVESVASGVMFGLFFVFFSRAGDDAGMWPTVAARVASVSFLSVVVLLWTRRSGAGALRVAKVSLPMIAGAGAFDVMANGLYLEASTMGMLSLISVVSAMYPASTVALARIVLHERMQRTQVVGLTLAGVAVALVALGRA